MRAMTKTATVALALITAGVVYYHATETTMTCTVTSKSTTHSMDGNLLGYQIDTAECGTLAIADVPLRGAWDSNSLYRSIDAGGTYELTTTGATLDALDWTPTVIDAEPA